MPKDAETLTRRAAIKRLGALIGCTMTASQLSLLAANAAAADHSDPVFFDEQQFAMLTRIADLIIPETDSPGALGAGVHHFIDMMFAEWASAERQAQWIDGLAGIDERAREAGMDSFSAGTSQQQFDLLRSLDHEYFEQGYVPTFFSGLKQMVLFAYYNSEVGATIELRYQAVPGDFVPCMPYSEGDRAWFWNGYSYGL